MFAPAQSRLGLIAAGLLACVAAVPPTPSAPQAARGDHDVFFEAYRQANPLVAWPQKELLRQIPELKHLRPDADQSALPGILARVGENVRLFVANALNTTSVETIDQTRIYGAPLARRESVTMTQRFNYLMVVKTAGSAGVKLEEYRTALHGNGRAYDTGRPGFFVTKGFASMPLAFSLAAQPRSSFRYLGAEEINKRRLLVVAFSNHADPAGVMGTFIDGAVSVPLLIQGIAWIDPVSYQIERMLTDLLAPQPSAHLEGVTTKVEFRAVSFHGRTAPLWLPREVSVDVYLGDVIFSNRHRYRDYEVFRVDTRQDADAPKPPSP